MEDPMQQSPQPTGFDLDAARAFIAANEWVFASSMPRWPHFYCLVWEARKRGLGAEFRAFVTMIYEHGYERRWGPWLWPSIDIGEHYYWTHWGDEKGVPVSVEKCILINRAVREPPRPEPAQLRLDVGGQR
jgi:hypothetical protein